MAEAWMNHICGDQFEAQSAGLEGFKKTVAIKRAFTDSVTRIYSYTIPLVLLAFVIALFIPELPLRRTSMVACDDDWSDTPSTVRTS